MAHARGSSEAPPPPGNTAETGRLGLRNPTPGAGGSGVVPDEETFCAVAGMHYGGVPGHGVVDTLASAEDLVEVLGAHRVVVMVNQANDWAEGLTPASERYRVAQSGLLQSTGAAAELGGIGPMSEPPTSLQQFIRLLRQTRPWWLPPIVVRLVFISLLKLTDFAPLRDLA